MSHPSIMYKRLSEKRLEKYLDEVWHTIPNPDIEVISRKLYSIEAERITDSLALARTFTSLGCVILDPYKLYLFSDGVVRHVIAHELAHLLVEEWETTENQADLTAKKWGFDIELIHPEVEANEQTIRDLSPNYGKSIEADLWLQI